MGGDSESAFKNTPKQLTFIPIGPFHKNFLKIWASDLVGAFNLIAYVMWGDSESASENTSNKIDFNCHGAF